MFVKLMVGAMVLMLGLASVSVNASLLQTDWKVAGDKKAFVDTTTGVEWLNLAATAGKSYNQVVTMQSGELSGWRFPTQTEMFGLMKKMFAEITSMDSSAPYWNQKTQYASWTDPADRGLFYQLFGWSFQHWNWAFSSSPIQQGTLGFFMGDDGLMKTAGVYRSNSGYAYQSWSVLSYGYTTSLSADPWYGYFLVSDGGATLSSVLDPSLNANNPNAPINQVAPPADVSIPGGIALLAGVWMMAGRSRKSRTAQ